MTPNESIFCQALAMTSLLGEMSICNFLQSDYYKSLTFSNNNDNLKKILDASGLGNPATMQMFLYALLVMPRELLTHFNDTYVNQCATEINSLCSALVDPRTSSTYPNENTTASIDYYRHIRNAVAHSRCSYEVINSVCYVTFKDENPNPKYSAQHCEIVMQTSKVGAILSKLQIQLMTYLNSLQTTN